MERDPHQQALLDAALRLGVEVELLPLAWGLDAVRYGGVLVLQGRVIPSLTHQASILLDNKLATKALLAEAGLPTPAGAALAGHLDVDLPVLQGLLTQGPIVVKPVVGTHGRGILIDPPSAEAAARHAAHLGEPALAEALIPGADLRLHALGGRVVAACVRTPPTVVGDGRTPIAALVEALDAEVQRPNPHNRALLDAHMIDVLAEQRLTPADVPADGQIVRLGTLANMARGARATDVTDALHPRWRDWVARAGAAFGLDVFAVDAMTPDPSADPTDVGGRILELNARPEWLHHTFSAGRCHDVGALLLRHLGVVSPGLA